MTVLDELFSYPELNRIFSDDARVQGMLQFEAALAKAEAKVRMIPDLAARKIAEQCHSEQFDFTALARDAAEAGNLAIPLIKQLTQVVARQDKEASHFVHWGATSQDAIDTGVVLQLRDAVKLIEHDLLRLSEVLSALAMKYRGTVVVARTWMQQALPTTFGYIVAGWLDAILRHRRRFQELRSRVLVLQFGGAVGTLAAFSGRGPEVAGAIAEDLQLHVADVPWHSQRDRLAELATAMGLLTGTLGKIARDISLRSQTELGELSEPAAEGRGGSTSMPNKRNPVTSAVVLSAAARVPGLVSTMLSAVPQEYERGLGGWHAEWETLPEIVRLTGGALHHLRRMLPNLVVNTERMKLNLEATHGLIFAEAISMALAERMGKMAAHTFVEAACEKAVAEKRDLKKVLGEDPKARGHLTPEELEGLFDARRYLGCAQEFVQRVFEEARDFSLPRVRSTEY